MSPGLVLLLGLAGGFGAVVRFAVDTSIKSRVRTAAPVGTITINLVGSFLLGLATGLLVSGAVGRLVAVAGTGFCGGFTTFSTASVEIVLLLRSGRPRPALAALCLNAPGAVVAAWLGLLVAGRYA